MTLDQFKKNIKSKTPEELARDALYRKFVYALPDEKNYQLFLKQIKIDYPDATQIAIMGSGNWEFSLNPNKNFRKYSIKSDIDIAIVCPRSFEQTWNELRSYHRKSFYNLSREKRTQIKRKGENVYSGFISPKWVPDRGSRSNFAYMINSNKYSNAEIGYRVVNMMYFKNIEEAVDYYVRGFLLAKKGLIHGI